MKSRTGLAIRGDVLRSRRLDLALTQQALARESKVDVGTIKKIESADGPCSVYQSTVHKIAAFFRCEPSEISERVLTEEGAA